MKFMQLAKEKQKMKQQELLDQIQRDVEEAIGNSDDENDGETKAAVSTNNNSSGRRVFKAIAEENNSNDDNEASSKPAAAVAFKPNSLELQSTSTVLGVDGAVTIGKENDFVLSVQQKTATSFAPNKSALQHVPVVGCTSAKATMKTTTVTGANRKRPAVERKSSNPWLKRDEDTKEDRQSKKQKKQQVQDETEVRLKVANVEEQQEETAKKAKKSSKKAAAQDNSEDLDQDAIFKQEIKKQAFADDDLELEFQNEKVQAVDKEIAFPDLSSAQLPGWGDWAGKGTNYIEAMESKKKKVNQLKTFIRNEKSKSRADNEKSHVIIRATAAVPEKYLKPAYDAVEAKILDTAVAHPLGEEWNSALGYRGNIKPRYEKVAGAVIRPLNVKDSQYLLHSIAKNEGTRSLAADQKHKQEEVEKERADLQRKRLKSDLAKEKAMQDKIAWERKMHVV